jgi:hypothetical protein
VSFRAPFLVGNVYRPESGSWRLSVRIATGNVANETERRRIGAPPELVRPVDTPLASRLEKHRSAAWWLPRMPRTGTISAIPASAGAAFFLLLAGTAFAGPPYISDDPQPTDEGHYEIYAYTLGTTARDDTGGEAGIDFNYGAAPDLQLTAVVPYAYDSEDGAPMHAGLGSVELAAKYRFLHQDDFGLDVAFFPRVFLPSATRGVEQQNASLFLPIWAEKDWDKWSAFGGGGCELNRNGRSRNFCQAGWVLARQILPDLQLGAEIVHQSADTEGGRALTAAGAGITYDLTPNYHLMAYAGPGIQNAAENDRCSWYAAVQFTF